MLIMVDVDGVLNSLSKQVRRGYWRTRVEGGPVVDLNPDHARELLQLAEDFGAELVWCTMWEDDANREIGPRLGLPQLRVVPIRGRMSWSRRRSIGDIKAASAAAFAGSEPFVWFDDERDAREHAAWYAQAVPHLVVQVDHILGLRRSDFAKARAWLEDQRAPRVAVAA